MNLSFAVILLTLLFDGSLSDATTQRGLAPDFNRAWGSAFCDSAPTRAPSLPSFPAGTQIRVQCPDGYDYMTASLDDEPDVLTCQSDGRWNKNLGSCQRSGPLCTKPAITSHVRITQQSPPIDESQNQYSQGSYIDYGCDSGYSMVGSTRLTCTSSGTWNPPRAPTCVTNSGPVIIVTNKCYMPAAPTNGDIQSQSASIDDGTGLSFAPGSQITYRCRIGYVMVGPASITCNSVGNWDRHPPQCAVSGYRSKSTNDMCRRPPVPLHGRNVFTYPENNPDFYPLAGRIRYTCDRGYTMRGAGHTIECQSNGVWSPFPPECS